MERLFVDSSAWLSLANRADSDHEEVSRLLASFPGRLVTSNLVFAETVTLARHRLGHRAALTIGNALRDPDRVDMVRVTVADEEAAWKLFGERADKEYSLADCASFVLMRRLGIRGAVALDADFRREGFEAVP